MTTGKIVVLQDGKNGDIFPQTTAKAIYLNDGKTLEDSIITYKESSESIIVNDPDIIGRINNIENGLNEVGSEINKIEYNMTKEGCIGDGNTDNSKIIQTVIDKIEKHGVLKFDDGIYKLDTDIDFKDKSIYVIASNKVDFIGDGLFPSFDTNPWHRRHGNHIKFQPQIGKTKVIEGYEYHYGDSALSAEISPNDTYKGYGVGLFASAKSNNCKGGVWGANVITRADKGYTGLAVGIELDIDSYSDTTSVTSGLCVTGIGDKGVDFGIVVDRANETSNYNIGINVKKAKDGIIIENVESSGLIVNNPPAFGCYVKDAKYSAYHAGLSQKGFTANEITENAFEVNNSQNGLVINSINESGIGVDIKQGGLRIGQGTKINKYLRLVNKFTFPQISAHETYEVYWTPDNSSITGDDSISCQPVGNIGNGLMWNVRIEANQVVLRIANISNNAITPVALYWIIDIWKH